MDNSPCWDSPLARIAPADPGSYERRDLTHSDAADRPTDLDYGRYVRLCTDYRDHDYDDARTEHAFAVEDPCLNGLLAASEYALADIAAAIGKDPGFHRARAQAITAALLERLYDPESGLFRCRDLRADGADGSDALIGEGSVAGLVPLIVPDLPEPVVRSLLDTLRGDNFALGRVHMVPSYDLTGPAFDPARYWRGPSWFNVGWLLHRGLRSYGATLDAKRLREDLLEAAGRTGFAEYVDPHTGDGRGIRSFSWTAATTLDLIGG
jgi:hypothetical protein